MALLNSLYKCPGTGFVRGRLRKFMLRAGIGYFNWGDIRPFLACSQGHRAGLPTLRDSLSRGCSVPAEFCARWSGGRCEADVTTPQHALGALLAQAEASGAGEGPAPPGCWGGACISPVQGPLLHL